jgi:hypothetical protein
MKQSFHRFLRWCFGKRAFPRATPEELPAYDLEWTHDDAKELKRFLDNPTGSKLLKKGRAMEAAAAIAACKGASEPSRVAGISDTLDWFASLTKLSEASSVTDANYEADNRENVESSPWNFPLTT